MVWTASVRARALAVPAVLVALVAALLVATAAPALADGNGTRGTQASRSTTRTSVTTARLAFERRVVGTAAGLTGIRYRWGGTSPATGFDCSGYVGYVFRLNGRSLPRSASEIYHSVQHISRSQARPGDLVFFHHGGSIYHVGIYAGGGMLYHASRPGHPTAKARIWTSSVYFGRVS